MGYSSWGRKESDTTERLHLTSQFKKKKFKGQALNIHSDVPQIHMLPDRNYYLHYHM